ncbi:centrosomal protein of 78 kDa [Diachasma alloeum]|uniref:centrosomal protein of 78 kDa n=1 Tax=Diachasma alloeum TaxID=454923 RepID=UPI0010FB5514|nr:centrosomal protein of 78 kDa [Diachasma alloeum]
MRRPWRSKPSVAACPPPEKTAPNCQNFATCYMELCRQQKLRPLPVICVTLPHSLDFTTDRVKMDDWGPILHSLSLDRTLKSVSVRSRYQCRKPLEEVTSADKARAIGKAPIVLTRYLLEWLSHSVAQCVRNSPALTCLELEGVPLPDDCLAALCVGLASTETLQHLSLKRCYIGDNSCALVCRTIADVQSIRSLNLSQCDLTSYCGPALASALSRQKLLLYHDTWKDSLRYREPNIDAMPGLRRLTLNDNPHLGDSAVAEVIDAIQDSLWLKALDLQHCGLTDAIGNDILQLLEQNTTLEVVDLRGNANLSDDIVGEVFKRLDFNHTGCRLEYRYFKVLQRDNRAISAGDDRRERTEGNSALHRPKSAVTRNKRSCQANALRKVPPVVLAPKRTKLKPPIPHFPVQNGRVRTGAVEAKPTKPVKPLLHLDLQTQIKSTMDEVEGTTIEDESEGYREEKSAELEELLAHLAKTEGSEEKMMNEMKQMEVQLKEERARREVAEMKLRLMRRDLEDLENSLKAKEIATRGYLLISQKSLDEIAKSFEELLRMLEDGAERSAGWRETDVQAREVLKRKVTLLLRKTKSEKLERSILEPESPTKGVKSTGDVSTTSPPVPSQLERQVGDTGEGSLMEDSWRRQGLVKSSFSPCERARALFKQIINGDVVLNLHNRMS